MPRVPHLLSKSLDPVLGVFTGVLAFYLHETNPRTAPASEDERLGALLKWKLAKSRSPEEPNKISETGDDVMMKDIQEVLKTEGGGKA